MSEPIKTEALQVQVTVKVAGTRLIVADPSGGIKAIYSNTTDPDVHVFVHLGSRGGPTLLDTTGVLERYRQLEPLIDWGRFGLVYSRP